MVGLPASGKTTRVDRYLAQDPGVFLYSTDQYITSHADMNGMTYDQAFSDFIAPATLHMNDKLNLAIFSKQNIIWDQTNLSVKKRRGILQKFKNTGYEVSCECFMPPESIEDIAAWNLRLASRPGKTIPDHIMKSMVKSYVIPSLEEGFDTIQWTYFQND